MRIQINRPRQGKSRHRTAELMMGTALGGALIVLAAATPAAADDECGAPVAGVVTCTVAGGPYTSGVRYTSAVELRAEQGVVINGGLEISAASGSIVLPQGVTGLERPSVVQSGDAVAVSLVNNAGNVFAFFNDVTSTGNAAVGVYARSATTGAQVYGDVLKAGVYGVDVAGRGTITYFTEITLVSDGTLAGAGIRANSSGAAIAGSTRLFTTGDNLVGMDVSGEFGVNVSSSILMTNGAGAHGIIARALNGSAAALTTGTIETQGDDSIGIDVSGGDITVTNTSVVTHGDRSGGIVAASTGGTVSIASQRISTEGEDSAALTLDSAGPTTVNVSEISTLGDRSHGIDATVGGDTLIRFDSIITEGEYSNGLQSEALTGAALAIEGGDITTGGLGGRALHVSTDDTRLQAAVGEIVTHGEEANGVYASSNGGDLIIVTKDITTDGRIADAALLYNYGGGLIDFTASDITTAGDGASGVFVQNADGRSLLHVSTITTGGLRANAIEIAGGDATVTVTGRIITTGDEADGVTTTEAGDITLDLGDVTTTGDNSDGIDIDLDPEVSDPVTVDITAGAVTTSGQQSRGVHVRNRGDTTISLASVATGQFLSDAVHVDGAGEGNVSITVTGAIATQEQYSNGIEVVDAATTRINVTDVTTNDSFSSAIVVRGDAGDIGPVTVVARDIATHDFDSYGIDVQGGSGDVSVTARDVSTEGDRSTGVRAGATGDGAVSVTARNITTGGINSTGLSAYTERGDLSVMAGDITAESGNTTALSVGSEAGDVAVQVGDIVANGSNNATGIRAGVESADATLTLSAGNVRTVGNQSRALNSVVAGTATFNLGDVSTQGVRSEAIAVNGQDGNGDFTGRITVNAGDISTVGQYSAAVRIAQAESATVIADSITASGEGSAGVEIGVVGDATVDIAGAVNVLGGRDLLDWAADGIRVHAGGTATVRAGSVTTSADNADGVDVIANDVVVDVAGRITTSGDGANGVYATGNRSIEVVVGGVMTAGSAAHGVYAIGDGEISVSSSDIVTSGAGAHGVWVEGDDELSDVTVNVGRAVASGDGARGVLASGGDVSLSVGDRLESEVAAELTAGGDIEVLVHAGARLTGENAGLLATSGTTTTIVNRGVIDTLAGYAIDTNGGGTSLTNEGALHGRINLTDNHDSVANSGEFRLSGESDFGGENDVFNNTGVVSLIESPGSVTTASFINLERFNNAGVIALADGQAGDQLTLRDTVLHGLAGSRITMDLDLTGATPAADRLTVGALEGVNAVELHVQGRGAVGETGVTLIASGAAQTGNEVTLTTVGGGFLNFDAVYDAASREFRVVAEAASQAFEPTRIASGAQSQWRRAADVVSARFDELRDSEAMGMRRGGRAQFWAQAFSGSEEVEGERRFADDGSAFVDLTHDVDARGAQFAVDVVRAVRGGTLVMGLAASVGETKLKFQSNGDTAEFSGAGVGVYAHWSRGPLAVGALAKIDRYDLDYRFVSADLRDSADGETTGARLDASWRMPTAQDWVLESQGSVAWTDTDLGGIEGEAGEVEFGDTRSLLVKAGVRLARTLRLQSGAVVQPFVGIHRLGELDGKNASRIHLNNQVLDVNDPGRGAWTQLTAGANMGAGVVQGFAQGEATLGDVRGYTARVGLRLNW